MIYHEYRFDYKCPICKTGTMKWKGEEFHSSYVIGQSYCDNPTCPNSEQNKFRLVLPPAPIQEAKEC